MTDAIANSFYETGEDAIIHADCLDALRQMPERSVDFILTDPPYLVRYRERAGRTVINDSNDTWLAPSFAEMQRVLRDDSFCVSFYGWPDADRFMGAFRAAGFRPVGHLAFTKRYCSKTGFVRGQHECAYLLAKGRPAAPSHPVSDVIPWSYTGNRLHPTQKPVSALTPLIEAFSPPGGLVLDPFAGSGSTLVAARSRGRRYCGIEIDPVHHATACRRLAAPDA
jgi:site-specific DNA-methyltransferase (adenine-specific)